MEIATVMLSVDNPPLNFTVIDVVRMAIGLGLDYWAMTFYTCNQLSREITESIDYPNANPALTSLVVYKKYNGAIQQIFLI